MRHLSFVLSSIVIGSSALLGSCGNTSAPSQSESVEDISSMTLQSDGTYRVTCRDGTVEYRTASDIRNDNVCHRGGGGGGGSGLLRCIARDNDGRDPWIVARFNDSGVLTRFPEFVFETLNQCQDVVNSAVLIGWDTYVFCASRDRDGRDPWSLAVIANQSSQLATRIVYGTASQCRDALVRSRRTRDFLLTCASRDADGRDPWSFATINYQGQINLQTDTTWGTFDQCLSSL